MVLNMISTATMVRLGYVTGNRMTSVQTKNVKLRARAVRILMAEAGVDEKAAAALLEQAEDSLPVALVIAKTGCELVKAKQLLAASAGNVQAAVEACFKTVP